MLRTALRLTPSFIPLLRSRNTMDHDYLNTKLADEPETGFDRVKKMFSRNEFDEHSIELHTVIQSTMVGAFCGACLGGFVKSREAYLYFIENNQATIFKSTKQAQKKLQDYVTIAFCKGAVHWGWRLSAFTGIFSLISTVISVYRGDTSLVDFVCAGTIAGGMYKCNLGIAATLVGAGLGCVLSTIGGILILGILKITGINMVDIRKALYSINEARKDQMRQAEEKASKVKNDALTMHHDAIVLERGTKKIEDI